MLRVLLVTVIHNRMLCRAAYRNRSAFWELLITEQWNKCTWIIRMRAHWCLLRSNPVQFAEIPTFSRIIPSLSSEIKRKSDKKRRKQEASWDGLVKILRNVVFLTNCKAIYPSLLRGPEVEQQWAMFLLAELSRQLQEVFFFCRNNITFPYGENSNGRVSLLISSWNYTISSPNHYINYTVKATILKCCKTISYPD